MYICDAQALDAAVAAMANVPVVAVDTEFMRERTYYARLCLVQMATADEIYLLDAIALGPELRRLAPVLSSPTPLKVFHAGSQDIEVLLRATGVVASPVFDTQIAATLAGFPTQVGYGQLAKELVGALIDKGDTFTDWAVRPLTDAQTAYAAADVAHLIRIYEILNERLTREGRVEWLAEDFGKLADPATYSTDPGMQYLRVKRASTLDRRSLGVLREIAAWREVEAQHRDMPKRWLVSDESLVEIARRRPKSADELSAIRGVNERTASRHASGLLAAVRKGEAVAEEDLPRLPRRARVPKDAQPLADLLSAVVRVRAAEHGVAPTLFSSRDDLERFASGDREGHVLSEGWRHALVGSELESILDGKASVSVENGRIVVTPAERQSDDDD